MTEESMGLRRCVGSARFGIEPHEAPLADFPRQPSQKDGLGRMCRIHWNAYTAGLAREAKARKAAAGSGDVATSAEAGPEAANQADPAAPEPEPAGKRRGRGTPPAPVVEAKGDPG